MSSASRRTPRAHYSSGSNSFNQYAVEQQNDEHVEMLSQKTAMLKEISLQIGDEVTYQEKMLKGMEDDFMKTGDLVGTAMRRLTEMTKTQSGKWMCIMILFIILIVFYLVFLHKRS